MTPPTLAQPLWRSMPVLLIGAGCLILLGVALGLIIHAGGASTAPKAVAAKAASKQLGYSESREHLAQAPGGSDAYALAREHVAQRPVDHEHVAQRP